MSCGERDVFVGFLFIILYLTWLKDAHDSGFDVFDKRLAMFFSPGVQGYR